MRWTEIKPLLEGDWTQKVYHAIDIEHAITALKNDKLYATSVQRFWSDGRRRRDNEEDFSSSYWMKGVSLTRDFRYAASWSNIVFVLDVDKIRQRFKVIPFSWAYHMAQSTNFKREREEYVIVKRTPDTYLDDRGKLDFTRFDKPEGEIPNLNSFLLAIYVLDYMDRERGATQHEMDFITQHPKFAGFVNKDTMKVRQHSVMAESIENVTDEETKFWYSSKADRFVDHDIDTHHVRMLADDPANFDMTADEVAHHPHANGDYAPDYEEDDEDWDGEEWADNNDMGLFANVFSKGWVRGGHEIDVYQYHEYGQVHHDGGIYLQGSDGRSIQRCVRACLKRWPDVMYFRIESDQCFFELKDAEQIKMFVRYGRIPGHTT